MGAKGDGGVEGHLMYFLVLLDWGEELLREMMEELRKHVGIYDPVIQDNNKLDVVEKKVEGTDKRKRRLKRMILI